MDEQKFREGLNQIIPTLKLFVAGYNDDGKSFIELLNSIDKKRIEDLYNEYLTTRKQEKINRVRTNILKKLKDGDISLNDVDNIFDDEKKQWPEGILRVRNRFRILYPFCCLDNGFSKNFFLELATDLRNDCQLNGISDPWAVGFDGSNNFGADTFYLGFGNNTHPTYKTMKQFRIQSIGDSAIRVGLLKNDKYLNGCYSDYNINSVTYGDLLNEALKYKNEVINDIYNGTGDKSQSNETLNSNNTINLKQLDLNTILYGVPGTGKTYNTINYAVAAIEGKSVDEVCQEDWNTVKDRYNQYKSNGQIVFTTFHQSFGYEDFIEGIKAKVGENGNINYDVESGIFKNLCEVADSECNILNVSQNDIDVDKIQIFKMSLGEAGKEDDIYDYCMGNNVIATGFGDMDFTDLEKNASPKEIKEFIKENNPNEESRFTADAIFRFKTWMNVGDLVIISKGNLYVRAIGKVTSEYYYDENTPIEYKHFRKVEWLLKDVNIPVERISNKKFSQQSIYNLKDDSYKQTYLKLDEIKKLIGVSFSSEKRNYVLIIDEINRGNISKIFGELITLIEPNKRLGGKEQIKVKLPYSQKEFGVPSNLYIIGTMNTADRSIALIDLALRRRFTFKEIEPNSQLLQGINIEGINVASIFDTMNRRIEFLYDRDHLLGHAYFLPLKSEPTLEKLNNIMLDKIIPLLQEYFHDDWEKIQLVLGKGLIHSEEVVASDVLGTDNTDYEDQTKYSINLNPSVEDYNI